MKLFGRKYLSKEDLKSLSEVIAEAERNTSGEIRVVARTRRTWKERRLPLFDLALKEFHYLGMQNTRDRTAILILVLFAEHQFQIVADEGINAKVEDGLWQKIAASMADQFKEGKYVDGIADAVRAVGTELAKHFPRKPDDTNELSNEIVLQSRS